MNTGEGERPVPVADPAADHAHLRQEILAAMARVFDSGTYILGPEVDAFERSFAARYGAPGAVGVDSGTGALVLALLAAGVGRGDEVITVSHTAGATVAAIRMIDAAPVLVDIDPETYCLDPGSLQAALSPRTKVVLPVHLYGHPADLDAIGAFAGEHGLALVEDVAQAEEASIGERPLGTIGDIGCFSFYPTKNLGAIGDGGLVTARRQDTIERLRHLRTYGWSRPQFASIPGGRSSRLDELQAAVLSVKLRHVTTAVERRRAIAARYNAAFADLPLTLPVEKPGCRHVYHLYVVRTDARAALAQHLHRTGIATGIHYPHAVHRQPGLAAHARVAGSMTATEEIGGKILSLPMFPSLSAAAQERVIDGVRAFFEKRSADDLPADRHGVAERRSS
jgi:dTDP-4-amino-4,6-dideoxygalactose transaminase